MTVVQLQALPFSVDSGYPRQSGYFMNARIDLPMPWEQLTFFVENRGSLYLRRHIDRATDTRYLDVFTPTLRLPVWGNLSVSPRVDIFLFETKPGWNIHGYQTTVTLDYSFDWHTGVGWKRALLYQSR